MSGTGETISPQCIVRIMFSNVMSVSPLGTGGSIRRGHLWLVDPADRTLEAFEFHDGQWLLIASAKDDDPISIQPFDAITFIHVQLVALFKRRQTMTTPADTPGARRISRCSAPSPTRSTSSSSRSPAWRTTPRWTSPALPSSSAEMDAAQGAT